GTGNGGWLVNGAKPNTASAPGLISTALTWEQIRNWNFGADWAILDNRLTGSFDYYLRYTDNGVGPGLVLPATLGTAVPRTNNIDIVTKGFEFSLGWNDQKGDFGYGARLNLSDNTTKVLAYNNPTNSLEDRKSTRLNSSHVKISYAVFCLKKKTPRSTAQMTL